MRRMFLILSGAGLVGLACGTARLNAGSNGDGGTPGTDAGPQGLPWLGTVSNSFETTCDLPAPDWLAGAWQGEFDRFALPSGSKAVRIEFTGSRAVEILNGTREARAVCGTVTFGEGTPPPLASDPLAAPPGVSWPPPRILEGFAYEFFTQELTPLDGGAPVFLGVQDQRVRFGITLPQIYKSWCNLQLSYPQFNVSMLDLGNLPSHLYRCAPPGAFTGGSNGEPFTGHVCDSGLAVTGTSCVQGLYCFLDVCDCSVASTINDIAVGLQGCTVQPTGDTVIDLSLVDAILAGSIAFVRDTEGLHFTRAP